MCGICGIVKFRRDDRLEPGVLEAMTNVISHRGPDDCGYFREGEVGLGHRRLSIIDLECGRQPMFNEDDTVVVVFNGEIYNFAEITADLRARGHVFKTHSDTEAIVHAYEEYGDECVSHFRGMFAFALWDRVYRRLLLARDRLGIKPLYYYRDARGLAFSSEIKSLLEHPEVPREVDPAALEMYLALRYVPGRRTMFRDIVKLQPGHVMTVENGRVQTRQYWDIPCGDAGSAPASPRDLSRYREEFSTLLTESVRLRMIADVPLGVFLSGGIDSSAILATMSKLRDGEGGIKTFSIGYETPDANQADNEHNEFAYARQAANAFHADHHEFTLGALDFRDFIPKLAWHLDEPLGDPSCIPLYFISRLARQHITVVLSGEGADEILGGYAIYPKMLAMERMRRIPGAAMLARWGSRNLGDARTQDILRMAALPLEKRYRGVSRGFRPELQARLLGRDDGRALDQVFSDVFNNAAAASPLDRMLYADGKVWLPDDLLLKADKMTMANSLELRVPFLDHKLVEFAARLPQRAKLSGNTGKVLLRKTMEGVLPDSILNRTKKGFPVPTMDWLRGPLRGYTRETLLASDSACQRYFDPRVLEEVVGEHEGGAPRQQELWTLLVFEHWHRAFATASAGAKTFAAVCSFDHASERL